jgi:hypothetical protein
LIIQEVGVVADPSGDAGDGPAGKSYRISYIV